MNEEMKPVVIGQNKAPEERIPLFIIDGVEYTVPKRPRPNVGLKFMRVLKAEGQEVAAAGLLEDMLGAEGFKALSECEELTEEDFEQVMNLVQKLALGNKEAPAKN